MSDTIYNTADVGAASFLLYVLSEDKFIGAEKYRTWTRFSFHNLETGELECQWLEQLYHSPEGAMLSNAKEYAKCLRTISQAMHKVRKVVYER